MSPSVPTGRSSSQASFLHDLFLRREKSNIWPHLSPSCGSKGRNLLQAIICQESSFDHFWIGYMPDNIALGRGISKVGFQVVSDLVVTDDRVRGLPLFEASERALASVDVFHLPVVATS